MNLRLLDPFDAGFPHAIEATFIDDGYVTTCCFNRWGTLLACGCHDGRIVIWDFDTRCSATTLTGHTHPVTSVSWSRNGRRLFTSSTDWTVLVWDVLSGNILVRIRFESAVWSVQPHPRNPFDLLVCPLYTAPVLLHLVPAVDEGRDEGRNEGGEWGVTRKEVIPLEEEEPLSTKNSEVEAAEKATRGITGNEDVLVEDAERENNEKPSSSGELSSTNISEEEEATKTTAARLLKNSSFFSGAWNRKGSHLYLGLGKSLCLVDSSTFRIVRSVKIPNGASIKSIELSRKGQWLLINCTDRVIRLMDGQTLEIEGEFMDSVTKMQWKKCCFSHNDDFVIGGSAQKSLHNVYIWNRGMGTLVTILEGPKEGVVDLAWHPRRPIIASCSTHGVVYIWSSGYTEQWSAYAPDFVELEENFDYHERESEFDLTEEDEDEEGSNRKRIREEELPEFVDVRTRLRPQTTDDVEGSSDDDLTGPDQLLYLPCIPCADTELAKSETKPSSNKENEKGNE